MWPRCVRRLRRRPITASLKISLGSGPIITRPRTASRAINCTTPKQKSSDFKLRHYPARLLFQMRTEILPGLGPDPASGFHASLLGQQASSRVAREARASAELVGTAWQRLLRRGCECAQGEHGDRYGRVWALIDKSPSRKNVVVENAGEVLHDR